MQAAEKDATVSRGATLEKAGLTLPFPDVEHPLLDVLSDIGWCMQGGMGSVPLSSAEVRAWCEGMQETLTPWEFQMVRRMSMAFYAGTQADRAPYQALAVRMALATASFTGGL